MPATTRSAADSRSSSPVTPDSSDGLQPIIHHDVDLSSWYQSLRSSQDLSKMQVWDSEFSSAAKSEEERMLQLDDLIEEHALDDTLFSGTESVSVVSCSIQDNMQPDLVLSPSSSELSSVTDVSGLVPSQIPVSCTRPIPPPVIRPRKRDPSTAPHMVVFPPKESCYNLPIMVPSIPESGTKSRVETQVRVTVDLAHASSSSGEPFKYDRVGSWKWLKLPPGTATKKRTRKEGKIDPLPADILHLTTSVTCATPPHNGVLSCSSCQAREGKRVARKLAARVRPARSDSEDGEDGVEHPRKVKEDTTSIVQFNCPEVLDFSTGSAVLPLRITCYCRHHREKVGFNVHFAMLDHTGRVIGTGTSPPIMITDDHKSPQVRQPLTNGFPEADMNWAQVARTPESEPRAPSKRKPTNDKDPSCQGKKRAKPYDSANRHLNSARASRETSVSSSSPKGSPSVLSAVPSPTPNTRSSTPVRPLQSLAHPHVDGTRNPVSDMVRQAPKIESSISPVSDSLSGQISHLHEVFGVPDVSMFEAVEVRDMASIAQSLSPSVELDTLLSSVVAPNTQHELAAGPVLSQGMPFMFLNPSSPPPISSLPAPKIHRLIPSSGPTHGGIEVTVLGENFHPGINLRCIFGDAVASSTQRWSDNALVCVLPPRAVPGVVAVWLEGVEKDNERSAPTLFTYTDESDRALMELALQVVGLKMTGKIEDAKNVALRIVGTSGTDDSQGAADNSHAMQLSSASPSSLRDIRPLLLRSAGQGEDFETMIIKFLSLLDLVVENKPKVSISSAISHATQSGQTLLHLAAFLGFPALLKFLIEHDIDLDARDRNGYTALHFSIDSKACAKLLVQAGADLEIVSALGKTPAELATARFFDDLNSDDDDYESDSDSVEEDEESQWGDAEMDDEDDEIHPMRRSSSRASHRRREAGRRTPRDPVASEGHLEKAPINVEKSASLEDSKAEGTDEKQAASFIEVIQRTLAQLHAPQGIMANMLQLPVPHLPEIPGVHWVNLPQTPLVFPVYVPTAAWPSFLTDKHEQQQDETDTDSPARNAASGPVRAAQEWRAVWEKWVAAAMASTHIRAQLPEDEAPPEYTPRDTACHDPPALESDVGTVDAGETSAGPSHHQLVPERTPKRVPYEDLPPADQDVDAYGYRPVKVHTQKHDRMLVLFWLPILLISLLWALHSGTRLALNALKTTLSMKFGVRA